MGDGMNNLSEQYENRRKKEDGSTILKPLVTLFLYTKGGIMSPNTIRQFIMQDMGAEKERRGCTKDIIANACTLLASSFFSCGCSDKKE